MKKKHLATKQVLAVITAASMAASSTAVYAAEADTVQEQETALTAEAEISTVDETEAVTDAADILEENNDPVQQSSAEETPLISVDEGITSGELETEAGTENSASLGSSSEGTQTHTEPEKTEEEKVEKSLKDDGATSEILFSDGNVTEGMQATQSEVLDGWVQEGENWCYYQNGEKLTAQEIQEYDETSGRNHTYRVDENGNRLSSRWYEDENGNSFYYGEDGKRVEGFVNIEGNTYYFEEYSGCLYKDRTEVIYDSETGIGYYYKFQTDGTMYTGWDGEYYYGLDGRGAQGLTEIDGDIYYFESGNWMQKSFSYVENGRFYFFGLDGKAEVIQDVTVDKWVQADGSWFYVRDGVLLMDQFLQQDGYVYYLNSDGRMIKDEEYSIYDQNSDKWYEYRFDNQGHMLTGWYTDPWENRYYYHTNGQKAYGITVIEGKTYYFGSGMYQNQIVEENGIAYYFGNDGAAVWQRNLSINGWFKGGEDWYYAKDGALLKSEFLKNGNYTYYFESDGRMAVNIEISRYNSETKNTEYFFFDSQGHMVTGWHTDEFGATSYYHENGCRAEGLTEIGDKTYYFSNGIMQRNIVVENTDYAYYFGDDGLMAAKQVLSKDAWFKGGANWYYIRDGVILKNQFLQLGSYMYYLNYAGEMCCNTEWGIYDEESGETVYYRFNQSGHMITGWYRDGEETWSSVYYYDESGRRAKGLTEIEGKQYYFDPYNGACYKDRTLEQDGKVYYFGEDGSLIFQKEISQDGWIQIQSKWYYIKDKSLVKESFLQVGNYIYYFEYNGQMVENQETSVYDYESSQWYVYRFDKSGHMITGWYRDGEETWSSVYYYDAKGRRAEGLTEIEGKTYYFSKYGGVMYTSSMLELDGYAYYFGSDGHMERKYDLSKDGWLNNGTAWFYAKDGHIVCNRFLKIGNYTYYFDYGGYMYADSEWEIYDPDTEQSYTYHFDQSGHMIIGLYQDKWGSTFYFDENGRRKSGLIEIGDKTYYFDQYNGEMETNVTVEVNGMLYYFGASGEAETQLDLSTDGWYRANRNWYYAKNKKLVRDELLKVGGYTYYFDYDGIMCTGMFIHKHDSETDLSFTFYVDREGHQLTGWHYLEQDGGWHYFGKDGFAREGIMEIDGSMYFLGSNGIMLKNVTGEKDGVLYFFGTDGKVEKEISLKTDGWKQTPTGWYYSKEGKLLSNTWLTLGNYKYYLDSEGKMLADTTSEWIDTGDEYIYRFDKNGHMVTGWYQEGNQWYYYDCNGHALEGLQKVNGNIYYFISGEMQINCSVNSEGNLYYFGTNGIVAKQISLETDGWKQLPDGWYYAQSGKILKEQWLTLGSGKYYFHSDGKMAADEEFEIEQYDEEESWYYYYHYRFDKNGRMVTGWYQTDEDDWYYYAQNGHGLTGLQTINGVKYYLDDTGRMLTDYIIREQGVLYYFGFSGTLEKSVSLETDGWKQLQGDWYYAKSGEILCNQFITLGKDTYYLDNEGIMASGKTLYIYDEEKEKNVIYRFDNSGRMVKGWYQTDSKSWYYYGSDGSPLEGIHEINGVKYYFSVDGRMDTNKAVEENGMLYYFGDSGVLQKSISLAVDGWKEMPCGWYYSRSGKILKSSWLKLGQYSYYLNDDGVMYADGQFYVRESNGRSYAYLFSKSGAIKTNCWHQENWGDWSYYGSDGRAVQGVQNIGGKQYYFYGSKTLRNSTVLYQGKFYRTDAYGAMSLAEDGWIGDSYYMQNGKSAAGWVALSGNWYYFNPEDGKKYTGRDTNISQEGKEGIYKIGNKYYCFDDSGVMRKGWIQVQPGIWRYAENSGALIQSNWAQIDGKQYYFNEDFVRVSGIREINGKYQLFDNTGVWQKELVSQGNGWFSAGTDWYYFLNGKVLKDDCRLIGGKKYAFDQDGKMLKNVEGYSYYFGNDGAAMINYWRKIGPGKWNYYDENGEKVYAGWKKIHDSWYYFESGKPICTDTIINGKLYHFSAGGASDRVGTPLSSGWNLIDGQYYYYQDNRILKDGWFMIGSHKYYFDYDGKMSYLQLFYENDDAYYFSKDGNLAKGWINNRHYAGEDGKLLDGIQTISGKKYYFRYYTLQTEDTVSEDKKTLYEIRNREVVNTVTASGTGWKKTSSGTWFYSQDGSFVSGIYVINGKQYSFDDDGVMQTDTMVWVSEDTYAYAGMDGVLRLPCNGWYKGRYYVDGSALTGARIIDGKYYYLFSGDAARGVFFVENSYYFYDGKGGRMKISMKDGWNQIEGNWYYLKNGKIEYGFHEIEGKTYYLSGDGMCANSLVHEEGNIYYADAGGQFVTGWRQVEGNWYYFGSNYCALKGKHRINGTTYIFDGNGVMQ